MCVALPRVCTLSIGAWLKGSLHQQQQTAMAIGGSSGDYVHVGVEKYGAEHIGRGL